MQRCELQYKEQFNATFDRRTVAIEFLFSSLQSSAAKLFLTISSEGTPILDIEIRYKGSYTANPQFQATATADLKKIFKSMNKESVE